MKLSHLQAEAVWLLLVNVCGAARDERDAFIRYAKENPQEYRFQGNLGFGGKLYFEFPPRVACYPEDETAERNRTVDCANEFLIVLANLWG